MFYVKQNRKALQTGSTTSIKAGPKAFVKRKQVSSGMKGPATSLKSISNRGSWWRTHTSSDAFTTSVAAGGNQAEISNGGPTSETNNRWRKIMITSADTAGNEVNNPNNSPTWQRKTQTRDLRPLTPERLAELVSETAAPEEDSGASYSVTRVSGKQHRHEK